MGGRGGAYLQVGGGGGRTSGFKLRLHIARLLLVLCLHFLLYVVLQGPGWDILVRVRDCTGHRLTVEGA